MFIKFNQYLPSDLSHVRKLLDEVANYYPNFDTWWEKVCIQINEGIRDILVHYENVHNKPVSVLILKQNFLMDKAKICTLFTSQKFRGLGLAKGLMQQALSRITCSNVIITIPQHQSYQYQGLIRKFNFDRIGEERDKYVKGHTEVIFRIKGKHHDI